MKQVGWEGRLIAYIGEKSRQDFKPGTLDCALFFADCVQLISGEDLAARYRGKYKTLAKGRRLLQADGFADHVALAAAKLEELPTPLMAQRGDGAVGLDVNGEPALGIVQGSKVYFMTHNGLTLVPLTSVSRAFRV